MRQFKGVFVGVGVAALLMASGCKPNQPRVNERETGNSELNTRDVPRDTQAPASAAPNDLNPGTSGSGTSTGDTSTGTGGSGMGDIQSNEANEPATDTTTSPRTGTTGTGTEGSDMGSGGATNSAQDQGTPPR